MDAITKRLWDQLEKELKDLYDYLDLMAPPKEEKENDKENFKKITR